MARKMVVPRIKKKGFGNLKKFQKAPKVKRVTPQRPVSQEAQPKGRDMRSANKIKQGR